MFEVDRKVRQARANQFPASAGQRCSLALETLGVRGQEEPRLRTARPVVRDRLEVADIDERARLDENGALLARVGQVGEDGQSVLGLCGGAWRMALVYA